MQFFKLAPVTTPPPSLFLCNCFAKNPSGSLNYKPSVLYILLLLQWTFHLPSPQLGVRRLAYCIWVCGPKLGLVTLGLPGSHFHVPKWLSAPPPEPMKVSILIPLHTHRPGPSPIPPSGPDNVPCPHGASHMQTQYSILEMKTRPMMLSSLWFPPYLMKPGLDPFQVIPASSFFWEPTDKAVCAGLYVTLVIS